MRNEISNIPVRVLMLSLGLVMSGCAGNQYKGTYHVRMDYLERIDPAPEPVPDSETKRYAKTPPIVAIEYVVSISPDAMGPFIEHVDQNYSMDNNWTNAYDPEVAAMIPNMIDEMLAKNQYYSIELYNEMVSLFPDHTVVMRPLQLRLDPRGNLKAVSDVEMVTPVLTLHFTAFTNVRRMVLGIYIVDDTFADLISPRIFMEPNVDHDRPYRVVAGTLPVLDAEGRIPVQLGESITTYTTYLRFKEQMPGWYRHVFMERPYTGQEVYHLIPYRIKYHGKKGPYRGRLDLEPESWSVEASPFGEYWRLVARTALEVVNTLDSRNQEQVVADYLRILDLEMSGSTEKFLATLQALIQAEAKFLSAQDENMVASLYFGDFGKSIRELIRSEQGIRSGQYRAQNMMIASSFAGAVGGFASTVAASQGTISSATRMQIQTMTLQSNLGALGKFKRDSITLADLYQRNFAPIQADAREFVIKVGEEEMEIQANSLQDMREKFRKLLLGMFPDQVREVGASQ